MMSALSEGRNQFAQWMSGTALTCIWCLFVPISLLMSFWMPAALLFAVVEDRVGAAFEFGRIYNYIRNNFVNYLLAFLVFLVARFAVPLGAIAFCIGIVFTAFWALVTGTYAFAQAYRLSPTK
jgi:hypothetical protein